MEGNGEVEPSLNIETKFSMLPYEKQIYIDIFESDALLIIAK